MGKIISEKITKRSVLCNIMLALFLFFPVLICLWSIYLIPMLMFQNGIRWGYIPLEINCVIALLSAYGFLLKNRKMSLFVGITTLYSIIIAVLPFFTTASDPVEGLTSRDYINDFHFSFLLGIVVCLIVFIILILPLLIKKNGYSALSLLESGGIFIKARVELIVVLICNISLIISTYMMVLQKIE